MNILVPTDFSAESLKAVDYAASLLLDTPGTLHLVHVHDVDYAYAVPALVTMPPLVSTDEIERHLDSELRAVAAKYGTAGENAKVYTRIGRAYDQICQLALELKPDLLVIATHGHTGVKHLVLGSTAERVVQHASCPVLVVREWERDRAEVPADGKPRAPRLQKILAPVDFSDCSRHGLSYTIALAKSRGASVVLLHTIQVQPFFPSESVAGFGRAPSPGVMERAARMAMRKFVKSVDFGDVPHETAIEIGRAAQQICSYAEKHEVDLIITSTHGLTGFAHVIIGSTAEHVVRYAPCPVLVVPRRDCRGVADANQDA